MTFITTHTMRIHRQLFIGLMLLCPVTAALAQEEGDNELTVDVNMLGHGEMRLGGLNDEATLGDESNKDKDNAYFLMQRSRLTIDYKRTGLETKVTAQHSGVWGQKGKGNFNLFEAWVKLSTKQGLFAQIGRQALSYDDERIIGPNDWAVATLSHDVLRLGYEGHGHKVHAILSYNQNAENTYGGTYYNGGDQPYKTMHTLWYHYDLPKTPLGASVLFMNIGMQAGKEDGEGDNTPRTNYQQVLGGYLSYKPKNMSLEASYYHQMGKDEHGIKIDSWMASVRSKWELSERASLTAGYDYLSGDDQFPVPGQGQIGLTRLTVIHGFNPVYGSHHKFYGLMDFFYVSTYVNGFTPGLQNLYVGGTYSPLKGLKLGITYHYMAMATKLSNMNRTLGHDIDLEASYQIMKDVRLSAGFSFMSGTESMEKLKRATQNSNLRWGWFSLVVNPRIFSTKW